jgi:hypothetical protein
MTAAHHNRAPAPAAAASSSFGILRRIAANDHDPERFREKVRELPATVENLRDFPVDNIAISAPIV